MTRSDFAGRTVRVLLTAGVLGAALAGWGTLDVVASAVAQPTQDGIRTRQRPTPDRRDATPARPREESSSETDRRSVNPPAPRSQPRDTMPRRGERPRPEPTDKPGTKERPSETPRPATVNLRLPTWATDSIGLHKLRLSLNVQAGYQDYLKKSNPLVFVVSRTGRYASWRFCRPGGRCSAAAAARTALSQCDRIKIDNPCYIFAVGNKQVWRGAVEREPTLGAAVLTAWHTEHRGPEKAKGVVFYFRGYGAWRFPPHLSYRRVPPYVRRFAAAGWDVKTVEVPYYNRPPRNLPRIVKLIHRVVRAARSQKYRKVVLAGQSRGAWEIIRAANEPLPVDGLILVAPAAHGTRYLSNGRRNRNFDRGNPAFEALLKNLKAPRIAFAFFQRDPFMLASRVEIAQSALAKREGVRLFIIRRPDGLPGHNAGWSANFARAWAGCLQKFIAAPPGAGPFECAPQRFKIETPELIYSSTHLFEHGAKPVDPGALRSLVDGKRLYTAPEPRNDGWWAFGTDGRVTMHLPGAWVRANPVVAHWETRGSRLCILGSPIHGRRVYCYTVFQVADNVLALVMRSKTVRLMYIR